MALSPSRKAARKSKQRAEAEAKQIAAEAAATAERQRRAATRLCEWSAEAKRRARSLDERHRVWKLCDEFGTEATNLGVYVELRDLCEEAVAAASNPRAVIRARRYGKSDAELAAT